VQDFISEDDLQTFEGWLRYQAVDASTTAPGELAMWRRLFEEARQRSAANPKVGLMKSPQSERPGGVCQQSIAGPRNEANRGSGAMESGNSRPP
jgi:hypothetical protein